MVTYEIVIPPQHGSVVIINNTAEYNADPGYGGDDSFTYIKKEDGVEVTTRKVCIEVEVPVYPKIWRASGGACEVVNGLITGKLAYSILQEIDTLSGNPTGITKPNVPGDPDYVAPVIDMVACPSATGWRGYEPSAYCEQVTKEWRAAGPTCEVISGFITGKLTYTILEEVDIDTGDPTGLTKPNTPGEPDYVAPVMDPIACPPATGWRAYEPSAYCEQN